MSLLLLSLSCDDIKANKELKVYSKMNILSAFQTV